MPPDQAAYLDNILFRPGKVIMRGPFRLSDDMTSFYPVNPAGAFFVPAVSGSYGAYIAIGRKANSGSANVEPWNAPWVRPVASQLAAGSTAGIKVNGGTQVLLTYANLDSVPGPFSINFDGLIYGISYDSASAAVTDTNASYAIKPLSLYNVTVGATPTINVMANAPHGALHLIGYQARIWLLGGVDTPGGGTTHNAQTLFFTNPGSSGIGTASADWKDPVSGLTNKIVMDNDGTDCGVGMAVVRNGLLIFRRSSVWLLRGTTTANYTLVPISKRVGCVDARSIVETDDGVYFMSADGLMLTNGTTITNVSGPVMHTLRQAVAVQQNQVSGNNAPGYITCEESRSGEVFVTIGYQTNPTNGKYLAIFTAMYDPRATKGGAWCRVTSQIWANDCTQATTAPVYPVVNNYAGPLFGIRAPKRVVTIGDRYVTVLQDEVFSVDFSQPQKFSNGNSFYDQALGATQWFAIPTTWGTGMAAITTVSQRRLAQGHRYFLDYVFAASTNPKGTGWTLQPWDAAGNTLDTAQNTVVDTETLSGFVSNFTVNPAHVLMRFHNDWFTEINRDILWFVTWTDSTQTSPATHGTAELLGLGFEAQRTRELRTATT